MNCYCCTMITHFSCYNYVHAGLHLGGGAQGGIRPPFVASRPPKFFSGFTCSTVHTFKRATLSSTQMKHSENSCTLHCVMCVCVCVLFQIDNLRGFLFQISKISSTSCSVRVLGDSIAILIRSESPHSVILFRRRVLMNFI